MQFGNTKIGGMSFGSTKIGGAKYGSMLVFSPGGSGPVLPYTPVEYIETDGSAYINTGVIGSDGKSSEIKALITNAYSNGPVVLGSKAGTVRFFLLNITTGGSAGFAHSVSYGTGDGMPSITNSITNATPVIVRTTMRRSSQTISIKQQGDTEFTSVSKAQSTSVNTNLPMYLFCANIDGTSVSSRMPTGTRVYYCKIYSDYTFTTLAFDGVPCYYNGAYGLWDKVSDSFFGAVAGSGTFTGTIIS